MAGGAILVSDAVEARHAGELDRLAPDRARVVLRGKQLEGDPAGVEIAFFSEDVFPDRTGALAKALHQAPGLGWFHSFSAGVDHPWFQAMLARGIRLTTSAGASAVPIAHTVMSYLLAHSRDLRGWHQDQQARHWNPREVVDLQDRQLVVFGMGPIGREVARLGLAFGMRVIGVRRTPRGDEPCETRPVSALDTLLPETDALVLAAPLNAESQGLLSGERIGRLPARAFVVNVGRGALVDEPALTAALESGRLAGAGLDVFLEEPLPEHSRLWALPNVIVTPHSAGSSPGNALRSERQFLANLERFERGEPLVNEASG